MAPGANKTDQPLSHAEPPRVRFLLHHARAAFRAIARRCAAVRLRARAWPPSRPRRRRASSTSGGSGRHLAMTT